MTDDARPKECGGILARIAAEAAKRGLVADDTAPCEWPESTPRPPAEDEPPPPRAKREPKEPEPWWIK